MVTPDIAGVKAEAVVDGQYSAALTPALNTPAPTIADLFRFTNGAGYWGGSVQEILIYNIEHSVYDRQRLEGYIASKWGLRGLLAAGHPYKSTNPPPGGGDIVVTGYLPTAEITAQLNPEVYADLDGLLPTAAGLLDTEAPGPITISVTTGTGYAGSIYEREFRRAIEDGLLLVPVTIDDERYDLYRRYIRQRHDGMIEHFAGAFPTWLAPEQVRVMAITDEVIETARAVQERLLERGIRAGIDDRNETLNYRLRDAEMAKIPYMAVVGKREAEEGTVALRVRGTGKTQETLSVGLMA